MADAEEVKIRQEIEISDFILANVPVDEPPPTSLQPPRHVDSDLVEPSLEEEVEDHMEKATFINLRDVKLSIAHTTVDQFDLTEVRELGRSSRKVVHLVQHKDGREMARKTIQLHVSADHKQIHRELDVLRSCQSRTSQERSYLTTHRSFVGVPSRARAVSFYGAYSEGLSLSICMELMDFSLDGLLAIVGFLPEDCVQWVTISALKGIDYLKRRLNVSQMDLRPANLMVNRTGLVKLCGTSCVSATLVETMTNSAVGSRCYMPPECLDLRPHGAHSEVWRFGITLTELAMGRYPYPPASDADRRRLSRKRQLLEGKQWNALRQLVKDGRNKRAARGVDDAEVAHYSTHGPPPELPDDLFKAEIRDFVSRCLQKDPFKRATMEALMRHRFITSTLQEDCRHQLAQLVNVSINMSLLEHTQPPRKHTCLIL